MDLPVLDLSSFAEGSSSQSQQFASELLQSLQNSGFVKIVGHGIEEWKVKKLFAWVSRIHLNEDECVSHEFRRIVVSSRSHLRRRGQLLTQGASNHSEAFPELARRTAQRCIAKAC